MLTAEDLSEVFSSVLPGTLIDEWAAELGVVKRERKIDIRALVRALVLAGGTPSGGMQADALRTYARMKLPRISRAAFYQRFDEGLERLLAKLSEHAMAHAASLAVDLPGILGGVKDWFIVDSETVRLRDALAGELPGCGDYAAIKVHKTLSVGTGVPVRYHFSPAKEHDGRHLGIDGSWQGHGLIADLGYASLARLSACMTHGVSFVIRLKENWKPKVDRIARGTVTRTFLTGSDLDALIEQDVLVLDGKAVDMSVQVGPEGRRLLMRLVGIPTPKGYCFFLTNLPSRIGPWQIGDIYRIRWEIELANKLDKSVNRLDETTATKAASVMTMLHASLLASIITAILVHQHHLKTRPKNGGPRRTAPLHPMQVAKLLDRDNVHIASAMELDETEGPGAELAAKTLWDAVALGLDRLATDPNWRRRPSVLDRLRGTKPSPARKRSKSRFQAKALLK